ncbi:MAG: ABC transporter permease [Candidatus Hydrogenedentes bacterium]|nr:ABC transporter permease [Candidatus Hydrogenedentota bacterium]
MYATDRPTALRPRHHALSLARLKRIVKLGLKSLWNHRLRSLLTMLGIVFGVASVIAMLAIGEGASFEAQEMIRQMGSNNIIVQSVKPPRDESSASQESFMLEYGLTYADVDRIKDTIPAVKIKVPARIIHKDVWYGGNRVACDIYGTVPWYLSVANHRVQQGRYFTRTELDQKANVCVLDDAMARKLFPLDSPIGRRVHIGTQYYRVIGVMESRAPVTKAGAESAERSGKAKRDDASHRMFIPLTTAKERFGETLVERESGSISIERVELHEVTVMVAQLKDVVEVAEIIRAILAQHHKKADYKVIVPLTQLRIAERTSRIYSIVLGSIAAISLIVGGIGIMNIMLASVTERTREIGVRRALGARRRDIIIQFLVETVLLSGVGGIIGVALGLAIPFFVTVFADMRTIVTLWSPLIAFTISGMVGIVFGIYPAFRAANMDPVEALRHE